MLASLPGLLLIALVSGGHWGGEWGARTIRPLLARERRRTRILVAKWLTVWATGIAAGALASGQLAATAVVTVAVAAAVARWRFAADVTV
jgi:ABC-type transport system involved in multi-copper enzyme maturation permease subunit